MRNLVFFLILSLLRFDSVAQNSYPAQPPATPADQRLQNEELRAQLLKQSEVAQIPFRSVGPSVFGGRVVDLAVHPDQPTTFFAAYASGGLWKTENNGTSFTPMFDDGAVMTIGDIAVNWEKNIIWVGTGENNSSRSSYAGMGIYKSMDGGANWTYCGLPETHHIGRIVMHPTDENTVWVAALGHLYSPNAERGVYKTTDGGKTWTQTLFVDDNSGAIDLIMDPMDSNTLYAATWHRERRAWNFVESGAGSGIYKSTDGGVTWAMVSTASSGFPTGEGTGRIGLTAAKKDGKTVLFAILDNYNRRAKEEKKEDKLTKDQLKEISKEDFLKLDGDVVAEFLKDNGFPDKYGKDKVVTMVKKGEITPQTLVEYLEDANSLLFDTPVIGAELYRSEDGGKTWKRTHEEYLDAVFYSYGYYFGQVRVHPDNPDQIFTAGVPVLRSEDGGKTFKSINGENVHVDHHAIWINPKMPKHIIIGNDGGVNISYDAGDHWVKCNTPAVGQFYSVAVDNQKPYNIYGGLQDNGVWKGPNTYKASDGWHNSGKYPYDFILGGDGMQVAIDPRNDETVYTGFQFGNYFRINQATGKRKYITPKHDLGERPYRWNWQAPIHLSIHNPDIVYFGSHKLHRSMNQGDDWTAISADLTTGGRKGDVAYSTLTSIHESPLRFGLIYVGTDDGFIHVTPDGGHSWQKITSGMPEDMWVTRVQASSHEEGRVYAALNGYRWDDFASYIYRSDDYGKTWTRLGQDLPFEPVNVIKEDTQNEDLLYVGTDNGLYVSLDRGQSFMKMEKDLPAVAVHDLVVQERAKDLVIGTHGRSFYVAPIKELQLLTDSIRKESLHLFELAKPEYSTSWGENWSPWLETNKPKFEIPLFSKSGGKAKVSIHTESGKEVYTFDAELGRGLNYLPYELIVSEKGAKVMREMEKEKEVKERTKIEPRKDKRVYLVPGTYEVEVSSGSQQKRQKLVVEK